MMKRTRRTPAPRRHLVLHVSLLNIEPEIWRRITVPEHYSLHQLHRVLQLLFGWLDYHLYEFRIGERRFEAPDEEAEREDATATDLRSLSLKAGDRFEYVYDFGDNWVHDVKVENLIPVSEAEWELFPALLDGEHAGPHEDSGGPYNVAAVRQALLDPKHPEHAERTQWVGRHYDPGKFDAWLANQNLVLAAAWGAI